MPLPESRRLNGIFDARKRDAHSRENDKHNNKPHMNAGTNAVAKGRSLRLKK
jgi:hypothetical protein